MFKKFLLPLLLILATCSVADESTIGEVDPQTPLVQKIVGKKVWDSDGAQLEAYNFSGFNMLGTDSSLVGKYVFEKLYETDKLIYKTRQNPASYIGLALEGDNLVMYKKGTTEAWPNAEDVSFDSANKLVSTAKGEWINRLSGKTTTIDGAGYTVKADGHLYDSSDAVKFHYVENPKTATRTPEDGLDRTKAIYKKVDAEEYIGLGVNASASTVLYKNNGTDY